jgi:hypothetical protein
MKKKVIVLGEILAVIVIMAGVSWVLSGRRDTNNEEREARQLHKIYTASMLYKADNNDRYPESLVSLRTSNYLPYGGLTNPSDARCGLGLSDWPANPWMYSAFFGDPLRIMNARFNELNSYAFLPTWRSRYNHKKPWDEFIQEPNRGLITGLGLMKCQTILGYPSCKYYKGNPLSNPVVESGHPANNLIGSYMTVRVDGSLVTRHRLPPVSGSMSLEGLFFMNDSKVKVSKVTASGGGPPPVKP